MSPYLFQLLIALIFLGAALGFTLLGEDEVAIALVGAVIGQGIGVSVQTAVNGKGS